MYTGMFCFIIHVHYSCWIWIFIIIIALNRGAHISITNDIINPNRKGILASDYNATLRENRNISLSIFRNLGVGRSTMEV